MKDRILFFDCLPSTNTFLKEKVKAGELPDGPLTVTAKTQSAGRGRADHTFFSPPGGLYASTWIPDGYVKFPPELLTVAVAVALRRAIAREFSVAPSVKWVNDLYHGNKKIAGILCEHGVGYIVGVGVNVYCDGWPGELRDIAGAILDRPDPQAPERLLRRYLSELEKALDASPEEIVGEYRRHLFLIGKTVTVDGREAEVLSLDDRAGLLLRYADTGETAILVAGEVSVKPCSYPPKRFSVDVPDGENG